MTIATRIYQRHPYSDHIVIGEERVAEFACDRLPIGPVHRGAR